MHEKMGENRTWAQFLPNTGRMDYLHALAYNHGYVCVVERAAGIEVPERAEYIRVITVRAEPHLQPSPLVRRLYPRSGRIHPAALRL